MEGEKVFIILKYNSQGELIEHSSTILKSIELIWDEKECDKGFYFEIYEAGVEGLLDLEPIIIKPCMRA